MNLDFNFLPKDVIRNIIGYLTPSEMARFQVSKKYSGLIVKSWEEPETNTLENRKFMAQIYLKNHTFNFQDRCWKVTTSDDWNTEEEIKKAIAELFSMRLNIAEQTIAENFSFIDLKIIDSHFCNRNDLLLKIFSARETFYPPKCISDEIEQFMYQNFPKVFRNSYTYEEPTVNYSFIENIDDNPDPLFSYLTSSHKILEVNQLGRRVIGLLADFCKYEYFTEENCLKINTFIKTLTEENEPMHKKWFVRTLSKEDFLKLNTLSSLEGFNIFEKLNDIQKMVSSIMFDMKSIPLSKIILDCTFIPNYSGVVIPSMVEKLEIRETCQNSCEHEFKITLFDGRIFEKKIKGSADFMAAIIISIGEEKVENYTWAQVHFEKSLFKIRELSYTLDPFYSKVRKLLTNVFKS